jgi:hypothetical protein
MREFASKRTVALDSTHTPSGRSVALPLRNRDLVCSGCHLYLLRASVAAHHTETRFATGPHVSPHRVDGFLPLRRRRRRRACRAVAPLGVALGVSSIAHHQMCRAHLAAIGLGGAARDPPRVRRGRRAPRHRHRVVHQGGARVRAPPARYVPNAKPRPAYAPRARTSALSSASGDERSFSFSYPSAMSAFLTTAARADAPETTDSRLTRNVTNP